MDNWLRSVWFIRIISLILAGFLWVTVNVDDLMGSDSFLLSETSSDLEVITGVPLEVEFDNEKYVVNGLPQEVTVTVEGPTSVLTPVVRQESFTVSIDLSDLKPGVHEVELQHSGFSDSLSVSIDPKVIQVTIEDKVSQDYKVNIDYLNQKQVSNQFDFEDAEVNPAEVNVTGSESVIDRIATVKAMFDVSATRGNLRSAKVPVKVYDSQGNELNVLVAPSIVSITVPIIKPEKTLPINIAAKGGAPEGVIIGSVHTETDEVTVYGSQEELDRIEDFPEIPIDISEVTEDETIEVEIPVPEGATKVDPKKIEVQIDVDEPQQ